MTIFEKLIEVLRKVGKDYNPDDEAAPVCVLWLDPERLWEKTVERLLEGMPELFILGKYQPEKHTGPGIWLRCVLARKIEKVLFPEELTPIFYLPGIRRDDLRPVAECPNELKPLAELQFRGTIWQTKGKIWTPAIWLCSQEGLQLDVPLKARKVVDRTLVVLLNEKLEILKNKTLTVDFLNEQIVGKDWKRSVLLRLNNEKEFLAKCTEEQRVALDELCRSQLDFDWEKKGRHSALENFVNHKDSWEHIWNRFCEAPDWYPNIPKELRNLTPSAMPGFENLEGWPQLNQKEEENLCADLLALEKQTEKEARESIQELENQHGRRRNYVWCRLGEADLAKALEPLVKLAELTKNSLTSGSLEEVTKQYITQGWQADAAALNALACVTADSDRQAVQNAMRTIYLPWLENSARYLQKLMTPEKLKLCRPVAPQKPGEKTVIMFVDGLRFDLGKALEERLKTQGLNVTSEAVWAALPTVTATGKPAVSPIAGMFCGLENSKDFAPGIIETGKALSDAPFKKILAEQGITALTKVSGPEGAASAWLEYGNIDHKGHQVGWKLAKDLSTFLDDIQKNVGKLLKEGWEEVRIVTDHGWLLVPGELPKIDLPAFLTESKWGRCAILKPEVQNVENRFPWYWDDNQFYALAEGISCFRKGEEYAHGGLSFQEALTLNISVKSNGNTDTIQTKWAQMICRAEFPSSLAGYSAVIRLQPTQRESAVCNLKKIPKNGKLSLIVEEENMEGSEAFLVVLDEDGTVIRQKKVKIGG